MVVGAQKIECGIEKPRLEQADIHRVGAILRTQAPGAESSARLAGFLEPFRNTDFGAEAASPLEDSQQVSRLRDLEARQRIEVGQHALDSLLVFGGWRPGLNSLGRAVHAVAFAEPRPLEWKRAVVVQRSAPEHAAVRHHAQAILQHLALVARAARDMCNPQIAGIHEADELGCFVVQNGVRADRIGRAPPYFGEARSDMGCFLGRGRRIAAMTIAAAQVERNRLLRTEVGVNGVLMTVDASRAFGEGHLLRLPQQVDPLSLRRMRITVSATALSNHLTM